MKTIKYKGKEYPVKLGYYALKHTKNELQEKDSKKTLSLSNLMSEDLEILEPLLYYSLVVGARESEQALDLKREEMEFVLDYNNNYLKFGEMIPDFFPKVEEQEKSGKSMTQPSRKKKK